MWCRAVSLIAERVPLTAAVYVMACGEHGMHIVQYACMRLTLVVLTHVRSRQAYAEHILATHLVPAG